MEFPYWIYSLGSSIAAKNWGQFHILSWQWWQSQHCIYTCMNDGFTCSSQTLHYWCSVKSGIDAENSGSYMNHDCNSPRWIQPGKIVKNSVFILGISLDCAFGWHESALNNCLIIQQYGIVFLRFTCMGTLSAKCMWTWKAWMNIMFHTWLIWLLSHLNKFTR